MPHFCGTLLRHTSAARFCGTLGRLSADAFDALRAAHAAGDRRQSETRPGGLEPSTCGLEIPSVGRGGCVETPVFQGYSSRACRASQTLYVYLRTSGARKRTHRRAHGRTRAIGKVLAQAHCGDIATSRGSRDRVGPVDANRAMMTETHRLHSAIAHHLPLSRRASPVLDDRDLAGPDRTPKLRREH